MMNITLVRIGNAIHDLGSSGSHVISNSFAFSIEKIEETLDKLGIEYSIEQYEECVKFRYIGIKEVTE